MVDDIGQKRQCRPVPRLSSAGVRAASYLSGKRGKLTLDFEINIRNLVAALNDILF